MTPATLPRPDFNIHRDIPHMPSSVAITRYALLQACYYPCNRLKRLKTKDVYIYFYLVLQRKIYMYTRTHTHTYTPA